MWWIRQTWNLKSCSSIGVWFEKQVLWLAAQPRSQAAPQGFIWSNNILVLMGSSVLKWLMVHKGLQDLMMGYYPEKFGRWWYGKHWDRGVLLLVWIPYVKIRGRHMFSAVRKCNFSSYVRRCLGKFLICLCRHLCYRRTEWGFFE